MESSRGYTKECKVRTTTSTNPLPVPTIHFVFCSSCTPISPVHLSSSASLSCTFAIPFHVFLLFFLHHRVILLFLYRFSCAGGYNALSYKATLHLASLNCFTGSCSRARARVATPDGTFLPRSSVQVRERRPEVFSLFAHESKASRQGKVRQKRDNLRVVTGGGRAPNSAPPAARERERLRFPVLFDIKGWGHFAR